MADYPFSRFARHVEDVSKKIGNLGFIDCLRSEGIYSRLDHFGENDLFLFLTAMEERMPLAFGMCRYYPMYPEVQSLDFAWLYVRLHELTGCDQSPNFDWCPDPKDIVPYC